MLGDELEIIVEDLESGELLGRGGVDFAVFFDPRLELRSVCVGRVDQCCDEKE